VATIRTAIDSFEFVFNTTLPGVIRVDGDRAFARFPVTELAKRRDGSALHFLGLYDDELRRTPAGWRFSRRTLSGLTLGRIDSFERSRTHPLPPYPGPPSWG
jgi:SnoaL-like domain